MSSNGEPPSGPPPPPGPLVREPDEDRGPIITTCLWVFASVAILLQIARLWSRLRLKKLGWDDYWMFITTALLTGFATIVHINMSHGAGRHAYYIAEEGIDTVALISTLSWFSHTPGILAIGTGKISVALMIMRFTSGSHKWLRISIWFCILTANATLVTTIFVTYFQCDPPAALWDPRVSGNCWDPNVQMRFSVFAGSYNGAADVYLALAPLAILLPLQLALKKKLGLCVLFGLGVLAGVCGFYKSSKIPDLAKRGDVTWDAYDTLLFTGSEIWLIIICGTVPALKPIWDAIYNPNKKSVSNQYGDSRQYYPNNYGHSTNDTNGIAKNTTIDVEISSEKSKSYSIV